MNKAIFHPLFASLALAIALWSLIDLWRGKDPNALGLIFLFGTAGAVLIDLLVRRIKSTDNERR